MKISKRIISNLEVLSGENELIRFQIAPSLGGKIISIFNKEHEKEFLWSNANLPLSTQPPGTDYDSTFWGGIDELIPNDLAEQIDGTDYPDHGELWTTPLACTVSDDKISVFGKLALSGLYYKKTVYVESGKPVIVQAYTIKNRSPARRHFLWKLHAALAIRPGDKIFTDAEHARVVDINYSRFNTLAEFKWPCIDGQDASIIPPKNNTVDFFYRYDIHTAEMQLLMDNGKYLFCYRYDKKIFPYQWYFASYGKFFDHYTAILEPCTNMPMSIPEARAAKQCAVLEPGQEINTVVHMYAGKNSKLTAL